MQWYEEPDELLQAARFRDVSGAKHTDLSWARAAAPDAASLRPPRLPSLSRHAGSASELPRAEDDEVSGLHPMPPAPLDLEGMMSAYDGMQTEGSEAAEPRRADTMIDDIVPRAEEEAFIAIRDAVARVEASRTEQFEAAERRLVDLAILVARRVIAREVSLDPGVVRGLVREGMAALGERDRVVIRCDVTSSSTPLSTSPDASSRRIWDGSTNRWMCA